MLGDMLFFFFFQAEDGIRDLTVTGVQTCALPILGAPPVQGPQTVAPPAGRSSTAWALTPLDDWIFAPDHAIPLLENQFGVLSLEGFGLAGKPAAAAAAGAIIHYVRTTQRGSLDHVDRI